MLEQLYLKGIDCTSKANILKGLRRSLSAKITDREREGFREKLEFSGLDLSLDDVILFSLTASLFSIPILTLFCLCIFIHTGNMALRITALGICSLTPFLTFSYLRTYTGRIAERRRSRALGAVPDAVSYMVMSLSLTPSLSEALKFSSSNSQEPLKSSLKRVSWNVILKKCATIDDAFFDYARRWGRFSEEFKLSLYTLKGAVLERSREGLHQRLERAQDLIAEGTRKRIRKASSSIQNSTTAFFAIFVLLPVIISAVLPLASFGGFNPGFSDSMGGGTGTLPEDTGSYTILPLLVLVVIFPIGAALYSSHILDKIPAVCTSYEMTGIDKNGNGKVLLLSIGLLVLLFVPAVFLLSGDADNFNRVLGSCLVLLSFTLPLSLYLVKSSKEDVTRETGIEEAEAEFPDALFQMGLLVEDGHSLESAIRKTARSLRGSCIGSLFSKVSYRLQVTKRPLRDVLFGRDGILEDYPSNRVRTAMLTAVESAKKEGRSAGKLMVRTGERLRELNRLENELTESTRSVTETMKNTALFFAPVILGVTASTYAVFSRAFGEISAVPLWQLVLANGIYLVFLTAVAARFHVRLEKRGASCQYRYFLGKSLPVTMIVYSAAIVIGQSFTGVMV